MKTQPEIELVSATEVARRLKVCSMTLKRRIARNGIKPDAVLIQGSTGIRSPLFVEPRIGELAALMDLARVQPTNQG
jgi:hypothetical protein